MDRAVLRRGQIKVAPWKEAILDWDGGLRRGQVKEKQ